MVLVAFQSSSERVWNDVGSKGRDGERVKRGGTREMSL